MFRYIILFLLSFFYQTSIKSKDIKLDTLEIEKKYVINRNNAPLYDEKHPFIKTKKILMKGDMVTIIEMIGYEHQENSWIGNLYLVKTDHGIEGFVFSLYLSEIKKPSKIYAIQYYPLKKLNFSSFKGGCGYIPFDGSQGTGSCEQEFTRDGKFFYSYNGGRSST